MLTRHRQNKRRVANASGPRRYVMHHRIPDQVKHLSQIIDISDVKCIDNLRMSRNAFGHLCQLLEFSGGLQTTKHVSVLEQVVIFLSVLVHHKKNCVIKHDFIRSGRTISKHFHSVLKAVLRLNTILLAKPVLVGMIVKILVGDGLSNVEGFLTPYRGVWYHLKEWERGSGGLQSPCELFNLRHALARNVIERTFRLLITRWGILRSPSYYSLKVQNRITNACCLLHNFVRMEMPNDPLKLEVPDIVNNTVDPKTEFVSIIDTTPACPAWRDELSMDMNHEWLRPTCLYAHCGNYTMNNQLESLMQKQFPTIDLRAEPHINSMIHVWKKYYGTLSAMMGKSDFGWDESLCMVTVESQDTWDEFCKIIIQRTVNVPTAEWCPDVGYAGNDKGVTKDS
ncbi:UNVERIFIED_CONTAM: hypothetical protein Sradi_3575800 [Sesamum radiatum]|uniref:DDE Tnp4 domain-containing protein n=1 Tax=Sesamum radiatum TaxID=300843 RepID=A0AAW2QHA8_SESRA